VDLAAQFGATWVSAANRRAFRAAIEKDNGAGKVATIQPGATTSARLTPRRADELGIPFIENAFETTQSTDRVDRHGDVVKVPGWHHKEFLRAGGPLLWSHASFITPIGNMRAVWGETKDKGYRKNRYRGIEAYHLKTNLSNDIYRLVDGGHLRSGSVGFIPLEREDRMNEDETRWLGFIFSKQEQLEYSKTPVPANPDAINGKSAEYPGLFEAIEETLDRADSSPAVIERAYFVMKKGPRAQVHLANHGYDPEPDDDDEPGEDGTADATPIKVRDTKSEMIERLFERADKFAERLEKAIDRLEKLGIKAEPEPEPDDKGDDDKGDDDKTPTDRPPEDGKAQGDTPEAGLRIRLRLNG